MHIYRFLMKHFSGSGARAAALAGGGGGGSSGRRQAGGGRVIVFVNAIGEARRLCNLLTCLRLTTFLLHSGYCQA